jgi:hypothetical protein
MFLSTNTGKNIAPKRISSVCGIPRNPFPDWCCQKPLRQTARQNIQSEQSPVDGQLSDKLEFIEL